MSAIHLFVHPVQVHQLHWTILAEILPVAGEHDMEIQILDKWICLYWEDN